MCIRDSLLINGYAGLRHLLRICGSRSDDDVRPGQETVTLADVSALNTRGLESDGLFTELCHQPSNRTRKSQVGAVPAHSFRETDAVEDIPTDFGQQLNSRTAFLTTHREDELLAFVVAYLQLFDGQA